MSYSREQIARRLLGAATDLFIADLDPISVQCLASSAAEHASEMARAAKSETFNDHILATFPEKTLKDIRKLRNDAWNAIKHSRTFSGELRKLEQNLKEFSDVLNDHTLFIVWYDFAQSGAPLPIPAQVFQVWYFELYPEKLNRNYRQTNVFGNLPNLSRREQKSRLQTVVNEYLNDQKLLSDPKTDPHPLILPNCDQAT